MSTFNKKWIAVAAGLTLCSASAFASHLAGMSFGPKLFNVSPSAVGEATGGVSATFVAGSLTFDVRSLVNQSGAGFSENGQVGFTSFSSTGIGSPSLGSFRTGLNQNSIGGGLEGYRLYALFDGTGTTSVNASSTIEGVFATFNTQIFVDKDNNTTFNANGSRLSTLPTGGNTEDVLVLTGTLQVGGFHVAGGLANGDFDVVFNVTSFGTAPFFSTTVDGQALRQGEYTGVNSTFIGILPPPNPIVDGEIDGSGNLVFGSQVPEPTSLALVGLALAGVGLSRKKKSA